MQRRVVPVFLFVVAMATGRILYDHVFAERLPAGQYGRDKKCVPLCISKRVHA